MTQVIKPGDTLLILGDDKQGMAIPPKEMFADIQKITVNSDICVKEGETGMPKIFGIPLIGVIQMVLGAVIFLLIRWPFRVHR